MSVSHFPALRVTALQAAAALAYYERHVRKLTSSELDMDLYNTVSSEIDEIKLFCTALPGVAAPWTALLVSHADLIHSLWSRAQRGSVTSGDELSQHLRAHLDCIDELARCCLRIAERHRDQPPAPAP